MKLAESTTDFEGTVIKSMASCLMSNHSMSVLRLTGHSLQNVLHGWKTPIWAVYGNFQKIKFPSDLWWTKCIFLCMLLKRGGCTTDIEIIVKQVNWAVQSNLWKIEFSSDTYLDSASYVGTVLKRAQCSTDVGIIMQEMIYNGNYWVDCNLFWNLSWLKSE